MEERVTTAEMEDILEWFYDNKHIVTVSITWIPVRDSLNPNDITHYDIEWQEEGHKLLYWMDRGII